MYRRAEDMYGQALEGNRDEYVVYLLCFCHHVLLPSTLPPHLSTIESILGPDDKVLLYLHALQRRPSTYKKVDRRYRYIVSQKTIHNY